MKSQKNVQPFHLDGTFSGSAWWAEMFTTLASDSELQKYFQFWWSIYNSGNPIMPKVIRGTVASFDGVSLRNPILLALVSIPVASGVEAHSIITVKNGKDKIKGKDGPGSFDSARVRYANSGITLKEPHSCQSLTLTIEEVRRILREHLLRLLSPVSSHAVSAAQRLSR